MNPDFDVVVVGGGHAGCEAALAAARIGARTALVTMSLRHVACMPCNPSVGGLAKSHLVFELDALGGEMARNTDYTGIQFKILNTSKGPAVRANRVQSDKAAYSQRMLAVLSRQNNLKLIESSVMSLLQSGDRIIGFVLQDGSRISSKCIVICSGTSLNGVIHIGDKKRPGGRGDANSADALAESIKSLGLRTFRLKTGTPARLDAKTIDFSAMVPQPGDNPPPFFSHEVRRRTRLFHVEQWQKFHVEQPEIAPWFPGSDPIPCHLTHTNERTHEIIRRNLGRSAMYGGHISGTGVRYCPSVEDKVVKFPDRTAHHVFIEPEGRGTDVIYPNGISNSLPQDAQIDLIVSIKGLERARILEFAYAIEYDCIDPVQLDHSLALKGPHGIYFAGQVNGTTGYEEAAAQGFIAGVNAAHEALGREPLVLSRNKSYIGLMISDLTTRGVDEPYRMFTSRSEFRLSLRQDNARYRLLDEARMVGIVPPDQIEEAESEVEAIECERARLRGLHHGGRTLEEILRQPGVRYRDIAGLDTELPAEVIEQVEIETKYEGYIRAERTRAERLRSIAGMPIPAWVGYDQVPSLRKEAIERLSRVRPINLEQALRIPGITPADISVLTIAIRRGSR